MEIRRWFLIVIFLFGALCTRAQVPVAAMDLPDVVCLNEPFSPYSTDIAGTSFYWNFCEGDLSDESVEVVINGPVTNSFGIDGVDIVFNGTDYFALVISQNNNKLFLLEFGNDPQSVPLVTDLGNPGDLLNRPSRINIIKIGGIWHAIITNHDAQGNIIHLDFGSDLKTIESFESLGNFGLVQFGYGLSHIIEDDRIILYVTNRSAKEIVEIVLSNDFETTVSTRKFVVPSTFFIRGNSFTQFRGQRIGATISESGDLYLIQFGDGSSTPQISEITGSEDIVGSTYDITLLQDDGNLYAMVLNREGFVQQVNFGNDVNLIPEVKNLGNFGQTPVIYFSWDWINYESKWQAIITDVRVNKVLSLLFETPCDATTAFSTQPDPSFVSYSESGVKSVSLTARNAIGEEDYFLDTLIVNRGPFPDFSFNNTCSGSPTFFGNETNFDSQISSTNWDFGDGNTSTELNPAHVYAAGGNYDVSLTVVDDCGVSRNMTQTIRIYDQDEIIPDYSVPGLTCSNSQETFTDQSEYGTDGPASYAWTVNGMPVGSSEELVYEFDSPGNYTVSLEVTGISGCTSSISKPINVIEGPNPSFTVDDACQGTTMQFNNTSTGQVDSYFWDFDNGITSTLENPEIQFDSDGQFLVSLMLTNSAGCVTQFTQSVTVYATPTVSFANELACERTSTLFRDESFAANANIIGWEWDFGDPESENNTANIQEPSHIFSSAGTYDVSLTTTTNFGCQSTSVQQVTVLESPTAAFSYDQACIGEPISFQDNSFPPGGESITSWAWDLGGTFSSQRNPTVTFDFARSYEVTLVVTGSNQCIARETKQLVISDPPIVQIGIQQPCLGSPVTFIDLTPSPEDPVISRNWDFGGLGLSSDSIASFTFPNAGRYQITLEVVLESGCTFSRTQAVDIDPAPQAAFTIERTFGPPPFTINAQSTSQNVTSLTWLLDGEVVGVDNSLNYLLEEVGDYDLALVVSSNSGCLDTARQMIQVTDPQLDITVSDLLVTFNAPPDNADHYVTLEFTVQNQGTLDLNSLPVTIVLDADYEITQEIEVDLPADNSPVKVNIPLQLALRLPLNICVKVPEVIYGVSDEDPSNNSACFSESLVVAYAPYPNPASDRVNFDILSISDQPVEIDVYSSSGIRTFSGSVATGRSGLETLTLDTSSWAAGTYILQFRTPEGMTYYRFVIQH